jgi:serine protease SohB
MWAALWDVISFLIKSGIILFVIIFVIMALKGGDDDEEPQVGRLKIKHLNEELKRELRRFKSALVPKSARPMAEKAYADSEKKRQKDIQKRAKKTIKDHKRGRDESGELSFSERPRMYVIDFHGDVQASGVTGLRREVSAILEVAGEGDRVLLRLDNSGGYVHTHGLAASQLKRLTDASVELWVAVDQVAASGGYLMACVADKVCAAPFSIIGSIGVIAQMPNVNRLLKRYDIDVELHTAGKYKRTLTPLGENTEEGRQKFIEDLNTTHQIFKDFVLRARPSLNIEEVATGETWLGTQAITVGLVDEVTTSDELILKALDEFEVYELSFETKRKLSERFLSAAHSLLAGRLPTQL